MQALKTKRFLTGDEVDPSNIELSAWILINTAGLVTIMDHRSEMGQGSFQSVPQIVAEELEVDLKDVNVQFAQGDNKKYGSQITGGSSTIRGSYRNLLNLGAAAREMLITAAAAKWNTSPADCYAKAGHVYQKSTDKHFHYGQLVVDASKLTPPKNVVLKKRADYKLIGKPLLRKDTPMKTNGTAIFGIDKKLPGMLYAVVERNPRQRGVVESFDDTAALQVPGVKKVFKVRMVVFDTFREGVAVVAESTWAAMQGKKALKVEWDDTGFEHVNTPDIYRRQNEYLQTKEGFIAKTQGDPNGIIEKADKKINAIYETPYQSHSPLEPVNCTAHFQGDKY